MARKNRIVRRAHRYWRAVKIYYILNRKRRLRGSAADAIANVLNFITLGNIGSNTEYTRSSIGFSEDENYNTFQDPVNDPMSEFKQEIVTGTNKLVYSEDPMNAVWTIGNGATGALWAEGDRSGAMTYSISALDLLYNNNYSIEPAGAYDFNNSDYVKSGITYSSFLPQYVGIIDDGHGLTGIDSGTPAVILLNGTGNTDVEINATIEPRNSSGNFSIGWSNSIGTDQAGITIAVGGGDLRIYPITYPDFTVTDLITSDESKWINKKIYIVLKKIGSTLSVKVTLSGIVYYDQTNPVTNISNSNFFCAMVGTNLHELKLQR